MRAGDDTTLQIVLTNPTTGASIPLTVLTDKLPLLGANQMTVANPATIAPQGSSMLTISLTNANSTAAILSADLVDTLPAGLSVNTSVAPSGTCDTAGVVLASNSVTYLAGRSVPPGGCTIIAMVQAGSSGRYVNTIPAGALQTNLGSNPTFATAPLDVNALAVPTLSRGLLWSLMAVLLIFGGLAFRRRCAAG